MGNYRAGDILPKIVLQLVNQDEEVVQLREKEDQLKYVLNISISEKRNKEFQRYWLGGGMAF